MTTARADRRTHAIGAPLLLALALLAAVAPIATDLYLPSFPELGADLGAPASGVQLTLTTFLAGLAVGQLVMGPLSDRFGRRRPLIASAAVCVVAGVVTALAPSIGVLVAARFVQGLAGAGGMVIGRAVIADLVTGREAARAFTLMMTVSGVAPAVAPLAGGLLFGPLGWRGLLAVVAALCAVMLLVVLLAVPETHAGRTADHDAATGPRARDELGTRQFVGAVVLFAASFGLMMAYISASPFLYQGVLGLGPVTYGVLFGVNACGLILTGAWVGRRVGRSPAWAPARVMALALTVQTSAATGFVLCVATGAPVWTYAVAIFVAVSSNGALMGNAAALAMRGVRRWAGTASAALGATQFALGAVVSPLVGLGGESSAGVPAVVMAGSSLLAWAGFVTATAGRRPESAP